MAESSASTACYTFLASPQLYLQRTFSGHCNCIPASRASSVTALTRRDRSIIDTRMSWKERVGPLAAALTSCSSLHPHAQHSVICWSLSYSPPTARWMCKQRLSKGCRIQMLRCEAAFPTTRGSLGNIVPTSGLSLTSSTSFGRPLLGGLAGHALCLQSS